MKTVFFVRLFYIYLYPAVVAQGRYVYAVVAGYAEYGKTFKIGLPCSESMYSNNIKQFIQLPSQAVLTL